MSNVAASRFARGLVLTIAACWASCSEPAQAANLVTNGDFETGNFNGWTVTPWAYTYVTPAFHDAVQLNPNTGTYFATLGYYGSDGTVSQSVPTIPGDLYKVSFAYFAENATPNDFTATFGSNLLYSVTNDTSQGSNDPVVWSTYTMLERATSSSTLLSFASRNDPNQSGLDSVSVIAVPEPTSIALLSLAGVGLVLAARRRNAKAATSI